METVLNALYLFCFARSNLIGGAQEGPVWMAITLCLYFGASRIFVPS